MNINKVTTPLARLAAPVLVQAGRAGAFLQHIFKLSADSARPLMGRVTAHPVTAFVCAVPLMCAGGYAVYRLLRTREASNQESVAPKIEETVVQAPPSLEEQLERCVSLEDPFLEVLSFLEKPEVQGDIRIKAVRELRIAAKQYAANAYTLTANGKDSSASYLTACARIEKALKFGEDIELDALLIETAKKAIATDDEGELVKALQYLLSSKMTREDLYNNYGHAVEYYPELRAPFLKCVMGIAGTPEERFNLLRSFCERLKNPSDEIRKSAAAAYLEILKEAIKENSAADSMKGHLNEEGWFPEVKQAIAKSMLAGSFQVNARKSTAEDVERLERSFGEVKQHLSQESLLEIEKWVAKLPESERSKTLIKLVQKTRVEKLSALALAMERPLEKRSALESLLLLIEKAGLSEETPNLEQLEDEYIPLVLFMPPRGSEQSRESVSDHMAILERKMKLPLPPSTQIMLSNHFLMINGVS